MRERAGKKIEKGKDQTSTGGHQGLGVLLKRKKRGCNVTVESDGPIYAKKRSTGGSGVFLFLDGFFWGEKKRILKKEKTTRKTWELPTNGIQQVKIKKEKDEGRSLREIASLRQRRKRDRRRP